MSKYPDECPLFRYNGVIWEGRPYWGGEDDEDSTIADIEYEITLVDMSDDDSFPLVLSTTHDYDITPLTPAAHDLIAWARGEG